MLVNNKWKPQTVTGNFTGNWRCHVLASRALNMSCSFAKSARPIESWCVVNALAARSSVGHTMTKVGSYNSICTGLTLGFAWSLPQVWKAAFKVPSNLQCKPHQIPKLGCFSSRGCLCLIHWRWVLTTSEWSTILLTTNVRHILDVWRYSLLHGAYMSQVAWHLSLY